ncbi:hypothetical protein [Pseudochryseolinea flava]|uniref:Uncharacterized protein n=1 Tax=Pseudochryseolinea flava TaxID=2059302 RepID=A0A364XUS2_9BACT|nr:hypothetical protein [Pseudochryseolinea flava]RAV97704.1 hypothetical protein DQQ10_27075 [Pseudochryseolinea flava]
MKTTSNIQQQYSSSKASGHVLMVMTGIFIAVICSFVLAKEMNSRREEASITKPVAVTSVFDFQVRTSISIGSLFK